MRYNLYNTRSPIVNHWKKRNFLFAILGLVLMTTTGIYGQDEPRRFNEFNMQPEVWHFPGPVEGNVDAKGDLSLSIPIMTVPGTNGLDFDIAFSYKAGSLYHATASWIGLGWNFDPGSISRDVQGNMKINNVDYGVDYNNKDNNNSFEELPDVYYVTLPGKGTLTMSRANVAGNPSGMLMPDNGDYGFYLEEYKPYKVEFEVSDSNYTWPQNIAPGNGETDIIEFTITTDDGVRYIFGLPTMAKFRLDLDGVNYIHPNAWRLLAIVGPDFDGDIDGLRQDKPGDDPGSFNSWIKFEYEFDNNKTYRSWDSGASQLIQNTYLKRIITPTHVAEFISEEDRSDVNFVNEPSGEMGLDSLYKRLDDIVLRTTGGDVVKIVKLRQNYQLAPPAPGMNGSDGKLTLTSIEFESYNDQSLSSYIFAYNTGAHNPSWSDGLNDHHYDLFGYYNDGVNPRLGSVGNSIDENTIDAQAWSLKKITFPTGGTEEYFYANDKIDDGEVSYQRFDESGSGPQTITFNYNAWLDPNAPARHQGGIRVVAIHRTDGLGNTELIDFDYGPGHVNGIPPKLPPWQNASGVARNEYQPRSRGGVDVYYEWVRRKVTDLAQNSQNEVTTYYDVVKDGFRKNDFLFVAQIGSHWAMYSDNNDLFGGLRWDTPTRIISDRGSETDTVSFQYTSTNRTASRMVSMGTVFGRTYELVQITPVILREDKRIKSFDLAEEEQRITTTRTYSGDTRQLKSETVDAGPFHTFSEITYAHEVSDYGGDTWDPIALDSMDNMRHQNILTPVAKTVNFAFSGLEGNNGACVGIPVQFETVSATAQADDNDLNETKEVFFSIESTQDIIYQYSLAVARFPPGSSGTMMGIAQAKIFKQNGANWDLILESEQTVDETCGNPNSCINAGVDTLLLQPGDYKIQVQASCESFCRTSAAASVVYGTEVIQPSLQSAVISTFSSDEGVNAGNIWERHEEYQLRTEDLNLCDPPNFDNWLANGSFDARWQLTNKIEQYKFGRPTQIRDANNNLLEIFYGDNDNNMSNSNGDDGLYHAFVTGIRLNGETAADTLSKQFDYDTRFLQVNRITDESGNTNQFTFDEFGRLISVIDANGNTITEQEYRFADFGSNEPNYIKTLLHFSENQQQESYEYFDGRARMVQKATRADGFDYYEALALDSHGRTERAYRPYRETESGTFPEYDQQFADNSDGFTENFYVSPIDDRLQKVFFPGDQNALNANFFGYSYEKAASVLASSFNGLDLSNIVWASARTTDESGFQTLSYTDELGRTALETKLLNDPALPPLEVNTFAGVKFSSIDSSRTATRQFTLSNPNNLNVDWVFDVGTISGGGHITATVKIEEEDGTPLLSEQSLIYNNPGSGQNTISGSVTGVVGKIYTITVEATIVALDPGAVAEWLYRNLSRVRFYAPPHLLPVRPQR